VLPCKSIFALLAILLSFQHIEMVGKPRIRLGDQRLVERLLRHPRLITGDKDNPLRLGSNANATRQTPSSAVNRSSFMLACLEPASVSAWGLPSIGPDS
jgi:hypothetical protein